MRWRWFWLLGLAVLGVIGVPIHADEQAATLVVLYPGVEIQRANTDTWLRVAQNAVMPFGADDSVRTNQQGRVLLRFGQAAQTLILPTTQFTLRQFAASAIRAEVIGRSVYDLPMNATHPTFDIITPHATIALAPGQFAIEITPDGITRVISAAGEANARIADAVMPVPAGYGLRFQDELTQPVVLAAPPHFARLDATLDGCVGRIRVVGDEPLYVRIGPGLDYEPIGVLENDTPVVLMAVSPNRDRYRIQYLSGFAWILATGVQTQCQNLPVLPYDTFEIIAGLNQPRAEELALLLPFFGAPKDDVWFYRIVAP